MTKLFSPVTFRKLTLRNRIGVSPMCQYSSTDGFANDWHLTHIGSRATGGAGLVIMEATGVAPQGRITPGCLGLWDDAHVEKLAQVTAFAKSQGAAIGIQLAHAGRKASCALPWNGGNQLSLDQGGWETIAPSAIAFKEGERAPRAMTQQDIDKLVEDFVAAALRAVKAGFQLVEIHGAHGYLLHSFLSPLSNHRTDAYGGSAENRMKLILDIARAVRAAVGDEIVVAARLSCSDWQEGGLTVEDSVAIAAALKKAGVDFIDCSSGGLTPQARIVVEPGYQVPFARAIRAKAGCMTAAVGMITAADQAEAILQAGDADMVFLARAMLDDPYWPLHAAQALGDTQVKIPRQYERGIRAPKP